MKSYHNGITYAHHILTDPERLQWVEARRRLHEKNQLAFIDSTRTVYEGVMIVMPGQPAKIYYAIAKYYGHPIPVSKLVKETRLPRNVVSAQASRLERSGLLKRDGGGYFIDIQDFLRFFAVRYDTEWRRWREVNHDTDLAAIVDKFIKEMKQDRSQIPIN